MQKTVSGLVYFLAETHYPSKGAVLVVTIVGPLVKGNVSIFQDCVEAILKTSAKWAVINFRDVSPQIDSAYIPILDSLLNSIRDKPAHVRLSGLHPNLKETLKSAKVLLSEELSNNLAEALQSLPGLNAPGH